MPLLFSLPVRFVQADGDEIKVHHSSADLILLQKSAARNRRWLSGCFDERTELRQYG